MDFEPTERQQYWRDRVKNFIEAEVRPWLSPIRRKTPKGTAGKSSKSSKTKSQGEGAGHLEPLHAAAQ